MVTQAIPALERLGRFLEIAGIIKEVTSWIPTPVYIFGRPTDDELKQQVADMFVDGRLLYNGVLLVPQVYARRDVRGKLYGHVAIITIEGVGRDIETAMLNGISISPSGHIVEMNTRLQEVFMENSNMLKDQEYERVPDAERGVFLKMGPDNEWEPALEFSPAVVRVEAMRKKQTLEMLSLSARTGDFYKKVNTTLYATNELIETYIIELRRKKALSLLKAARAKQEEAAQLAADARREYEKAASYSGVLALISYVSAGLSIAGVITGSLADRKFKQDLKDSLNKMNEKLDNFNSRMDKFNAAQRQLQSEFRKHVDKVEQPPVINNDLGKSFIVDRILEGYFIYGEREDGSGKFLSVQTRADKGKVVVPE